MTFESSMQQIQQRLTCPICLDSFKQPKLLPCQHTFCLSPCLTKLIDRVTRRIKCPECRMTHSLPLQGVDALPNNITIQRFLELDLHDITTKSSNTARTSNCNYANNNYNGDDCFQCNKKHENYFKCLDCEKFFCSNCKSLHLTQLRSECKQNALNLRRILPQLSEKVGNYEQKKFSVTQNFESVKRDISSVIEKLVEDIRNREKCLHAEAEIFMQSQIRTISLQKENAEIELATLSSFCDSVESILNNNNTTNSNNHEEEIALLKKQSNEYLQQTSIDNIPNTEINKLSLVTSDLNSMSNFINNFGSLIMSIPNQNNNNNKNKSNNNNNNKNNNQINRNNSGENANQFLRQGPVTSNSYFTSHNNTNEINNNNNNASLTNNMSYNLFDDNPRPTPRQNRFSNSDRLIYCAESRGQLALSPSSRLINNQANRSSNNTGRNASEPPVPRLQRSGTFTLEVDNTPSPNQTERQIDINQLYQVQRARRAKTPVAFNFMLNSNYNNEDENIHFELNSSHRQPKINYNSKTRAKLIIGKRGRDSGELIWPIDVALNEFNNQIIVSDSNNHRIQIFESNGKFVSNFGKQGKSDAHFDSLAGLFTDSMANIYVVDRLNHRVQIFDRYCRFVRSIGSGQGAAPGQLNHPWGVAVSSLSEIFICDKENDRICVFHLSGKFVRSFGQHGSNQAQFDKPYYVHITKDSKVIVSDSANHRIQVFDTHGMFLYTFGREGNAPGEFRHPRGVCTDQEGFILVADSGNSRIQVFRQGGEYVTHFGGAGADSGKFRGIEGIALTKTGDVIVCDKENNRVQIL